jgi:hypothetical protein
MKPLQPFAWVLLATLAAAAQFTEVDPGLMKSAQPCMEWGYNDGAGDLDVLVAGMGKHGIPFTTLYGNTGAFWRGTPGSAYRIETSEDLAQWTPVAKPTAASGTGLFEHLDIPPAEASERFYRAGRP